MKIKNVDHVEVAYNDFNTSGIIGRVETNVDPHLFEHVWIHDNNIHEGSIDIWTPTVNPTAVRIESNTVPNGRINAVRDVIPGLFNQTVNLNGGMPGGIYNNIAASFNFTIGINASGNTTVSTAALESPTLSLLSLGGGNALSIFEDSVAETSAIRMSNVFSNENILGAQSERVDCERSYKMTNSIVGVHVDELESRPEYERNFTLWNIRDVHSPSISRFRRVVDDLKFDLTAF